MLFPSPLVAALMDTAFSLPMSSARQARGQTAPLSVIQSSTARRRGNVGVHDPPVYARLYTLLQALLSARLRAFINTRKGLLGTVVIWVIVDLFVGSSDIAQIAQAMQQSSSGQGSAQTGISAWGLFSHSFKIIALVVYLYIEARRPPSIVPATVQYIQGFNLSQPSGPDLDVFVQSGGLELGRLDIDSVRTYLVPIPHLRSESHHAPISYAASPQPLKEAYVQAPSASSSSAALRVSGNSIPSEEDHTQSFHDHSQIPEEPTRPPPVLTRQHARPVRSKVIDHEPILRALPGEKRRQGKSIDKAITSPESPMRPPIESHAIHEHLDNQADSLLSSRECTRGSFLPTRPSSVPPGAFGPPGPGLIRQV